MSRLGKRLADYLRVQEVPSRGPGAEYLRVLQHNLRHMMPVVDGSDVAEMALSEGLNPDLPVAAPFTDFLVEFQDPHDPSVQCGVWCWSEETKDGTARFISLWPFALREANQFMVPIPARGKGASGADSPLLTVKTDTSTGELKGLRWHPARPRNWHDIWNGTAAVALYTLGFLGCKNVELTEGRVSRWTDREWKRKHGFPLVRYHILDIEPMRKVLRTEGRSDKVGIKRAIHVCRGHFVTYTEERPLFGKHVGTFYRHPHVRGSKEAGIVLKDYAVDPRNPPDGSE